MENIFANMSVPCCMEGAYEKCVCSETERVIRAYIEGYGNLPPMTQKQREYCIEEADWAGEGSYNTEQLSQYNDQELASAVLHAWGQYVRSNF